MFVIFLYYSCSGVKLKLQMGHICIINQSVLGQDIVVNLFFLMSITFIIYIDIKICEISHGTQTESTIPTIKPNGYKTDNTIFVQI